MDWSEKLKEETGIRFRTTDPKEIERVSFQLIKEELGQEFLERCPKEQLPILCRVIHTTADFSYRDNLYFSRDAVSRAMEAVRSGLPIITDTTMALSGINKRETKKRGMSVCCFIGDEDVKEMAESEKMTRSAVSVDKAAREYPDCIYAVGNAPTALMRLYELVKSGKIRPRLIIGVPVGFVNVEEAKELILTLGVPCIVARGRKGGSNVAAAICNALLYEAARLYPDEC